MDNEYLKFLKFRTELIELLNKYDYEISGTGFDDGSMSISNSVSGELYKLRSEYDGYEALDTDWNKLSIDYILESFPENRNNLFDNKKICIFTNDIYKAIMFFNKLVLEKKDYIERYIQSADDLRMTLKDGTYYVWVKPVDNSRGHRCSKAYIDKNLTLNELDKVIPICILCSKNDIEII